MHLLAQNDDNLPKCCITVWSTGTGTDASIAAMATQLYRAPLLPVRSKFQLKIEDKQSQEIAVISSTATVSHSVI